METARLKLQGIYSLIAGAILLLVVPVYQASVLGPTGYSAAATTAFNQGKYGPLLLWISGHGSEFIIFRFIELAVFLFAIRLPLALYRTFRAYRNTLARWMLVGGTTGLALFATMIALSTITFVNAAADYSQAASPAKAQDALNSFNGYYGIEALAQNTLGGFLVAIFLLCASLLIARSGKLSNLLVYFGLLAAALMAAFALLFAVSPPEAQTQLNTPALLSFAVWLIWLGILLAQRAGQLVAETVAPAAPASQEQKEAPPGEGRGDQQSAASEQTSVSSQPAATPSAEPEPPDAGAAPTQ